MNIYHISDSHTYHDLLQVPKNVDLIIFSGDCSIVKNAANNYSEVISFLNWFEGLPVKYKIFVAGNHDTSIWKNIVTKESIEERGIIYLENESTTIEGLNIWGSPYTSTFGTDWAFQKARHKMDKVWRLMPSNTDVVITHGPPKGGLDSTLDYGNTVKLVGCNQLATRIRRVKPILHLFGHIHNCKNIVNAGVLYRDGVYYSNGSVVTDGKFGKLSSNGNLFTIDVETKELTILEIKTIWKKK